MQIIIMPNLPEELKGIEQIEIDNVIYFNPTLIEDPSDIQYIPLTSFQEC